MLWFPASGIELVAAYLVDMVVGDPPRPTHPVVLMGRLITLLEGLARKVARSRAGEMAAGVVIALVVPLASYWAAAASLALAARAGPGFKTALGVWLISTTIAGKELARRAEEIRRELAAGNLARARGMLAMIVGRDTESLPAPEVARGAVETVAENTVDGVLAPLFYGAIGGAPMAVLYRAVNTLDSMLGYRDLRYRHLGWASARLDDVANYIPARVGGLLIAIAAFICRMDWRSALRCMRRDARRHPSPNSGYPEAAAAGALRVRLGGLNYYRGVPSMRAYLGEPLEALSPEKIAGAVALMRVASLAALVLAYAARLRG